MRYLTACFIVVVGALGFSVITPTTVAAAAVAAADTPTGPGFETVYATLLSDQHVDAGGTIRLSITDTVEDWKDVSAAVLAITVDYPTEAGFITVWPCAEAKPWASHGNYAAFDFSVTSTVFAKPDAHGEICVYSWASAWIDASISGVFFNSADYQSLTPSRLFDSRETGTPDAQSVVSVRAAGRAGIPADATHAVVMLTAVNAAADGFLTGFACGDDMPYASNLNYVEDATVANQMVVPLDENGDLCVYTWAGSDVLVDAVGYFAAAGDAPAQPVRVADSRGQHVDDDDMLGFGRRHRVSTLTAGVGTSSVVANVTVVGGESSGAVRSGPCDANSSTDLDALVLFYHHEVVANTAVLNTSPNNDLCLFVTGVNATATDVIVDVVAWTPAGPDRDRDGIEDADQPSRVPDTTAGDDTAGDDIADRDTTDNDDDSTTDDGRNDDGPVVIICQPDNPDCDYDGIPDADEPEECRRTSDCDEDGLHAPYDPDDTNPDVDSDGVLDGAETLDWSADRYRCVENVDCDDDGLNDLLDPNDVDDDIDNDHVLDGDEPVDINAADRYRCLHAADCDGDGLHDFWDAHPLAVDFDSDGILDAYDPWPNNASVDRVGANGFEVLRHQNVNRDVRYEVVVCQPNADDIGEPVLIDGEPVTPSDVIAHAREAADILSASTRGTMNVTITHGSWVAAGSGETCVAAAQRVARGDGKLLVVRTDDKNLPTLFSQNRTGRCPTIEAENKLGRASCDWDSKNGDSWVTGRINQGWGVNNWMQVGGLTVNEFVRAITADQFYNELVCFVDTTLSNPTGAVLFGLGALAASDVAVHDGGSATYRLGEPFANAADSVSALLVPPHRDTSFTTRLHLGGHKRPGWPDYMAQYEESILDVDYRPTFYGGYIQVRAVTAPRIDSGEHMLGTRAHTQTSVLLTIYPGDTKSVAGVTFTVHSIVDGVATVSVTGSPADDVQIGSGWRPVD